MVWTLLWCLAVTLGRSCYLFGLVLLLYMMEAVQAVSEI